MRFAFIVYLVLFVIGFLSYLHHKPGNVLVCQFAMGSGFFKFLPVEVTPVHPYDLMILLTLIITIMEVSKRKDYFKSTGDPVGRIILIVFFYTLLVCIGTVLVEQETLSFALKVVRVNIMFLLYFYFRKQDWSEAGKFLKVMLFFSIIQGVFFYLQLVGVNVLQGGILYSAGVARYKGYPSLSVFFVLLAMIDSKMPLWKRLFLFAFFGGALLLSMNRGPILTIIIAYASFIILHRRVRNLIYLVFFAGIYLFAVAPMMERRNNERSSGVEDLQTIIANPLAAHEAYFAGSGTAFYRIACVTERMEFLFENPQYIPFGVGTVHENSPKNHYNVFVTGLQNNVLRHGKETISSDDVTWVNILMRYGFIGVVLFLMVYLVAAKNALPRLRHSSDAVFLTAATLPLANLFASVGTNHFDFSIRILEFLLPLMIIQMYSNRRETSNCS